MGLTVNGNATRGIWRGRVKLTGLTAVGNGIAGVDADRVALRESVLSANGQADIAAARMPRLRDTTCERSTSQVDPLGPSWGVCSLDP